jgi:hypothetical protein
MKEVAREWESEQNRSNENRERREEEMKAQERVNDEKKEPSRGNPQQPWKLLRINEIDANQPCGSNAMFVLFIAFYINRRVRSDSNWNMVCDLEFEPCRCVCCLTRVLGLESLCECRCRCSEWDPDFSLDDEWFMWLLNGIVLVLEAKKTYSFVIQLDCLAGFVCRLVACGGLQ